MSNFDPLESARAVRENRLYPPTAGQLAMFGPQGLWRAGAQALETVLEAWWVGEAARVAPVLADAARWLAAPAAEGKPWGDPPLVYEAEHRHAQAVLGWMQGRDDRAAWRDAADLFDQAREGEALEGEGGEGQGTARSVDRSRERAVLAALAGLDPETSPPDALAAAVVADSRRSPGIGATALASGVWLARHGASLFAASPTLAEASLFALVFGRLAGVASPPACLAFAYVVAPDLPVPPALVERGWRDRDAATIAGWQGGFAAVAALMPALGLDRDADAAPRGDPPGFASWTRHPALDLEVDWHAEPGAPPWIEVRGAVAGRLAGALSAIGGRIAPEPGDALVELLTVPPTRHVAGTAAVRWEVLSTLLAQMPAGGSSGAGQELGPTTALIAAGLADTDWRVRMAAVWGVGRLRIAALAEAAQSAALPAIDDPGVTGEDRHTLLALRDAAAVRAHGAPPPPPTEAGAGPGGARRAAFVARIGTLIDAPPIAPDDRSAALVAAVLRVPGLDRARWPRAWHGWLG